MTQGKPFEQRWRTLGRVLPRGATSGWDARPAGPYIVRTADRYLMYLHFEEYHDNRNKRFFDEASSSVRVDVWVRQLVPVRKLATC